MCRLGTYGIKTNEVDMNSRILTTIAQGLPFLEVLTVEAMIVQGKRSESFYVVTGKLQDTFFADVVEVKGNEVILGYTLTKLRRS